MQLCVVNTLGRRLPVGSRSVAVLTELLVCGASDDLRERLRGALEADANLLAWVADHAGIDAGDISTAVEWLGAQPAKAFVDVFAIDQTGDDVSSSLAACLPQLAARLARLDDLERHFDETLEAEKLEAMAELAAGAGHEINNPLAVISGRAQLFLRQEGDPERRRAFASMNTQVGRVFEMISDLMLYARPPELQFEACSLVEVVDEVILSVADTAEDRGVNIRRSDIQPPEGTFTLSADRTQLIVAVRAIIDNALNELDHNGRVDISLSQSPDSGEARIAIRDNGPGVSPEVRRHLFDPFYSGRQAGRGLGMGLAKCWRIVTNHGGRVEVESDEGYGATFVICLPLDSNAKTGTRMS